jgi:hypothetical protein
MITIICLPSRRDLPASRLMTSEDGNNQMINCELVLWASFLDPFKNIPEQVENQRVWTTERLACCCWYIPFVTSHVRVPFCPGWRCYCRLLVRDVGLRRMLEQCITPGSLLNHEVRMSFGRACKYSVKRLFSHLLLSEKIEIQKSLHTRQYCVFVWKLALYLQGRK